ncbi:NUDIX hydrolase [bacterium]|nr:NUDIX hydrolase [bacterium]
MKKQRKGPALTVDIIIRFKGGIVLIERKNEPYGWAIPGGFVDYGESVEDAAYREAEEETSLEVENLEQFHVYSDPRRDPRSHTVSVVFTGEGKGTLQAADDARNAKVFTRDNLPDDICFDHELILKDYFRIQKQKNENTIL